MATAEEKARKAAYRQARATGQNIQQARTTAKTTDTTRPPEADRGVKIAQPQQPIAQPIQAPQPIMPTYDATQDIRALSEARKQAQISGLQKRYEQARGEIGERRAVMPQEYREQRRQASVQSKLGAKNFGEFLAARGLARSGEAGQARLMQTQALQGQLGAIGLQEQAEMDRLARQEQQLGQAYRSDIGLAEAGVEADMMQQLINARQQQEAVARAERIRQEDIARQTGIRQEDIAREQERYDYTRGLQEQQRAMELEDRARALQDYERQQYAQSIAGLGSEMDYAQQIMNVQNDGDPTNDWQIPLLQQERQRKVAGIQAAETKARQDMINQAESRLKTFGYVANEQDAQILGIPVGTTTADYDYKQGQLSLQRQKETRLGQEKSQEDKAKQYTYDQAAKDIKDIATEINYDPFTQKPVEILNTSFAEDRIAELYEAGRISEQTVRDLISRLKIGQ